MHDHDLSQQDGDGDPDALTDKLAVGFRGMC